MEYEKILTILRRYSFAEKMKIAHKYSAAIMSPAGLIDVSKLRGRPLPWDIETFVMFAVMANEWNCKEFQGKNEKIFIDIINTIFNHTHSRLEEMGETEAFVDWFMITTGAVQFDLQEYYPYRLYRFNYYFSFVNEAINMPELFFQKYGCNYWDFAVFAQFLWIAESSGQILSQNIYDYWISRHLKVASELCISRENYISELKAITSNAEDYRYCLRPSYSFPFIREKNTVYLPVPHLLIRAVTSSLLFRLTDGNVKLPDLIGKNVLEAYLVKIISDSKLFDEVLPEHCIPRKGGMLRTPDVMARQGDKCVFFDSKFYSPKRDLRILSKEVLEETTERLADTVIQIYRHITEHFPAKYNCFKEKNSISKDSIWGIVVIREDPHIRPKYIYARVAERLNITKGSSAYDWLCHHVGIVDINMIERYCFTSSDIIKAILRNSEEGHTGDFWLSGTLENTTITNQEVRDFKDRLIEETVAAANEMRQLGLMR